MPGSNSNLLLNVLQLKSVLTCSTFLQPQSLKDLFKLAVLAEIRQFDMHSCTQACAEVGWAGEDVAKVFIPHERVTLVFEQILNLKEQSRVFCSSVQAIIYLKCLTYTRNNLIYKIKHIYEE